jgi:hypothetical protein
VTVNIVPTFEDLVRDYQNTAAHNDALHRQLTDATWADPELAEHRRYIEQHQLGFGDPAFHAMWLRLLDAVSRRFSSGQVLEIGVFKGQVISLWALLARQRELDLQISAVGPLAGQPKPQSRLVEWLRYRLDRHFRAQVDNGNFYDNDNYEDIIRGLFSHFGLDFNKVTLHRGFSSDSAILSGLTGERFHLVYVDGDHTYEGALHDFQTFGPKIVPGGWLVADDAGRDLPGTVFWKGHESVSRAIRILPSLGFNNVLNVGHIRIYERVGSPGRP